MRILVVDDDEINRYQLQVLLSGHGYHVVTAAQGAEALGKAREGPPDLVITDILMPVMDGYALCRAWKQDERLRDIPLVFYTATYTDERDREFALSLGAQGFVVKPEEPDVLVQRVRELLRQAENCAFAQPAEPPGPSLAEGPEEETAYLRQYNEVLVHKLEDKLAQLERTTEELREAARIVEQSPVVTFRCLAEEGWRTVYISRNVSRFGHDAEQLVRGRVPLASIIHADDVGPLLAQAERIEREGLPGWDGRLRIVAPGGDAHWVDCRIVAERDAEGRVTGYSGVATDITKQVQLEAEIRQAQKLEALGSLAGGVAHDFNNLLVVIQGQSDLLLSDLPPSDERRERLEEVIEASQRAAALTRQLLAFSRRQPLRPRVLNLSEVVSGVAKMLRRLVPESIALEWDLGPSLPPISADPGQIEQVVLNLCVNARDAMPDGGTLTVATTSVRATGGPGGPAANLAPGEYAVLRVADSGSGMDQGTLEHIFEPFFTTKGERGTGLGLSVVYGIVRQSGGDITVTSEVGRGTSFDVLIPAAEPVLGRDDGPDERAAAPGLRSGATRTVLLAEDDAAVRRLVTDALERQGYQLLIAVDGARAVTLATGWEGAIDLLLTDVVMPGLSGPEVAERVRERHPEAKVLYVSGYAGSAVRALSDSPGQAALIDKPFTVSELLKAVEALLDDRPM